MRYPRSSHVTGTGPLVSPMHPRSALIAGVTGTVGGALASHLAGSGGWAVAGISRRPPKQPVRGVTYIRADLEDAGACASEFGRIPPVTHAFYCARATHREQTVESASDNLRLFESVLDAAEQSCSDLRHVHLVQGGKYYGVHMGPFPTPARESQDRCVVSNFYYDQQDCLAERSRRARWTWSASRPNTLLHFSPRMPRNIVSTLGAYAALCRYSGAALDFPGPEAAYRSLTQVTTIEVLARTIARIATTPSCAGQAFNVTNTDVFRWCSLWPRIAAACHVSVGPVRPMRLSEVMADKAPLWDAMCADSGLLRTELDEVANWAFADATLERTWDEILCHSKARSHGLDEWDESESRFVKILGKYQGCSILPVR